MILSQNKLRCAAFCRCIAKERRQRKGAGGNNKKKPHQEPDEPDESIAKGQILIKKQALRAEGLEVSEEREAGDH